jgi:serine/threonine protein kinase
VSESSVWLVVRPPKLVLPEHGWKLHVSSRPVNLVEAVDLLVPVLLRRRLLFKVARSPQVLMRINSGNDAPAAVGKAFTIYPAPEELPELGYALVDLLAGLTGPRIASDRQLDPRAPVFYRYGPFTASWRADVRGIVGARISGPAGDIFEGLAQPHYHQPEWATDPFGNPAVAGAGEEYPVLAGKYRLTTGVQRNIRGSVFRAERLPEGTPVIVKQARAYVGEDQQQFDARLRLRNERRVLCLLDGLEGVPRFLDHLRSGPDELLVTSDCGPASLVRELADRGLYSATGGARSVQRLAHQLAAIVAGIHGRGVLIRDLSPKNVVIGHGGPSIVDFGIAAADGITPIGFTPGYAAPAQRRGELPAAADDCYALGMTLLFALTGIDPVTVGDDPEWARVRALETLAAFTGDRPVAGIAGLLSPDPDDALRTLAELAAPVWKSDRAGRVAGSGLPRTAEVDADLAADLTTFLVGELVSRAQELVSDPETTAGRPDATVHQGAAGVGLQLLHHLREPDVPELVAELVDRAATAAAAVALPPGLYVGVTGVRVFLAEAERRGIGGGTGQLDPELSATDQTAQPAGTDLMVGAAGIGWGHLRLFELSGDGAALDRARRCAQLLIDGLDVTLEAEPAAVRTGVDPAAGFAHGRAGAAYLLATLAAVDADFDVPARRLAAEVAAEVPRLVAAARGVTARPLAASWCQGLAGVASALQGCSDALAEPELSRAAVQASQVCVDWIPRLSTVGQCCGLAGVGAMLIGLAPARRAAGLTDGLGLVAGQLLRRSSGPPSSPIFETRFGRDDTSWGYGNAGVLAFFRSMRDGEASLRFPVAAFA